LREQLEEIAKLEKGDCIGLPQMLVFQERAKAAILGGPSGKMNYMKAENPWKAWYSMAKIGKKSSIDQA
jgi:hypothetical protein